jgi:diguanylate cyclase (GGDEF)-like protein
VWESEKELFRRLNIDCVEALKDGKEIMGLLLLSAKDRGRPYNYNEISFLETLSTVASIAMKNAGLYEKMFREARIDALTGAYNYRYFAEQEEQQFRACRDDCIALLFVDVDDLKLYNQLYGVEEGNDALRRVSAEVGLAAGAEGMVFRTSGKVFAALLPHQDARRARVLAEEMRRRIQAINQAPERRAVQAPHRQHRHLRRALRGLQRQGAAGQHGSGHLQRQAQRQGPDRGLSRRLGYPPAIGRADGGHRGAAWITRARATARCP